MVDCQGLYNTNSLLQGKGDGRSINIIPPTCVGKNVESEQCTILFEPERLMNSTSESK